MIRLEISLDWNGMDIWLGWVSYLVCLDIIYCLIVGCLGYFAGLEIWLRALAGFDWAWPEILLYCRFG